MRTHLLHCLVENELSQFLRSNRNHRKCIFNLFHQNTYFTIFHLSQFFTTIVHHAKPLTIAAQNTILIVAGFLGPPLFINTAFTSLYKYYSIQFFSRKTIIGCYRNFKVMFHCLPSPPCDTKNSSESMTAWKSATKEQRKRNKKSNFFMYQSRWSIWILLCYKVTRKYCFGEIFLFKRYINIFGEQFLGDQFVILDPFPCHNWRTFYDAMPKLW